MAITLQEMRARRDALLEARWRGVRSVTVEGRQVSYASDAEMAAALADLERRIEVEAAAAGGGTRRRVLRPHAVKDL